MTGLDGLFVVGIVIKDTAQDRVGGRSPSYRANLVVS